MTMFFLFAWRYFRAAKSTNAINIIAWVSILAIIIGSASLVLVLSVFNGLEDLVKSLYSSFYTDLKISPALGKTLTLTPTQLRQIANIPGIGKYTLVAEDEALLQNGNNLSPMVYLKGVDSNYTSVAGLSGKMIAGKFELGTEDEPAAVLGAGIENALGMEADRSILPLTVYMFKKGTSAATVDPLAFMSTASIAAAGKFAIQDEFDNKYVITNLAFMKRMLGLLADEYSAVEISIGDSKQLIAIKSQLQSMLGGEFRVQTRYEQNQGLFGVMRMEKWVIYAVLTMILAVAAFNMVGALTMLVLEKQKDIQVLKAMGASSHYIQRIFLSEGVLLASIGGGVGVALALIICWLQVNFKLVPLQGDSFLIDYYPVKLVASDFILVLTTILVVALLASWFPSRKAATQQVDLRS
jgi:lipoprotein-releasing system permease protein